MSDVVEFAGVGVIRSGNALLHDVTWSVEEGERWVVIGPNGAGKTTLLQLAAARMHPTHGVAGVLGEVLGAVDVFELRPRIGVCSASIAERLPAGERVLDVVLTASWSVVGRFAEEYDAVDEHRAAGLLAALGVGHLSDRQYGTLSEGERKRVQIARALMTDPELMLLDEPAAGLDLRGREDLVARLQVLAEDIEAPALVLVTHHVEEIPPGFTDILMLREGEVVAAGPIESTLTAENLSRTFDLSLVVDRHGERWAARAAAEPVGGASTVVVGNPARP
ncbi:MAG: ABC transporter ATP-binding protein [Ornithinimicrobium sp.]